MDKAIFYPSAALGILFIVIYLYRCHKAGVEFSQSVMVSTALQSSGIVCGALLIAGCIHDEARKLLSEIDLYIFISGLVVLAGAVKAIYKDVFVSTKVSSDSASNKQLNSDLDFPQFSGHASITPQEEITDAEDDHGEENPAVQ